jgi:protein-S-isoprenylcysteine O-methyltransferase Ste14
MIWPRTLIFLLLVPGTLLFYVPIAIGRAAPPSFALGPLRWLGLLPLALGTAALLWCARDFAVRGRGTPAPIDPPRVLVVQGLYRYVRNPMYVGAVLVLLGHSLWFGSPALLGYLAAVFCGFHLFVVLYEEPALTRRFGDAYRDYLASVPRWLPRRPDRGGTGSPAP